MLENAAGLDTETRKLVRQLELKTKIQAIYIGKNLMA